MPLTFYPSDKSLGMNFELQKELFRRYPKVFRKPRDVSDGGPIDHRGVECGDGWFELVDRLSRACEREIEALISRGLVPNRCPRVRQVKEKLGTLRFYIFGPLSEEFRERYLYVSEVESRRTCSLCGATGEARAEPSNGTWCSACEANYVATGKLPADFPVFGDKQYDANLLALLDSRPEQPFGPDSTI